MDNNSKKFLVPISVAIAGLSAGTAQATVSKSPDLQTSIIQSQNTENSVKQLVQRLIFSKGDELHSLLLEKNGQGIVLAHHESHYSHSSHSSHSSHYSGG